MAPRNETHMATPGGSPSLGRRPRSLAFGDVLYRARIGRALTQVAAARLCGLTRGYYSQLENSKRTPPPEPTLRRIAEALRLSRPQTEELRWLAQVERCRRVQLSDELPAGVADLVRELTFNAHRLSPARLRKIQDLLTEDQAM